MHFFIAHAQNVHIWTSGLIYDVAIDFHDPAKISAIRPHIRIEMHIFYCAYANQSYFYFRFNIWRHQRFLRPRFPIRLSTQTFEAYNYRLRMGKSGKGDAILTPPNEIVFTFRRYYFCANFGENWSRNATRESAKWPTDRRTDRQTDWLTDWWTEANWFLPRNAAMLARPS